VSVARFCESVENAYVATKYIGHGGVEGNSTTNFNV
jgi:hypothetical protein